ncbi:E3 ubiquitin-protein ligase TRIM56-like [Lytechinus variegatus]|uniref:E3 ubiquitin-protein ligase TRIM56-like n=1 Tax=Lytechinus variegatus TaxID=7654 RepID=UPI001BB18248|nr:E3 ubiquitin-protein ligase TRIM56-like [Lytechinus variegatus]
MAARMDEDHQPRSTHTGLLNQVKSLQCPICYKLMTKPKMLPCGHTFCLDCLSKIMKEGKIMCAFCRVVADVSEGDANKLPTNLAFKSVVEEVANPDGRCDVCDTVGKEDRISYCNDCNIYICTECLPSHTSEKKDRHFIKKKRRSRNMSSLKIGREPCPTHTGKLCIEICVTCKVLVCKECITKKHQDHELQGFVEYATYSYASATPLKQEIREQKNKSDSYILQVQYHEQKTSRHITSLMSQIEQEYDASIKRLEERKRSKIQACAALRESMRRLCDDLLLDIEQCNTSLDQIHHKIQSVIDSPFKDMCAHSSKLESSYSELVPIKEKLNSIRKECVNMPNKAKYGNKLDFHKNSEYIN